MTVRKSIGWTFLIAALCLLLVACGGAGVGGQGTEQPTNTFEGRTARSAEDLDEYVEKAKTLSEELTDEKPDVKEGAKLTRSYKSDLEKANEAYRSGDYATAETGYQDIIKKHSTHYGANVNLTLALLQQEKNDDALTQALTCLLLYPYDLGPALNVQAAGVAAGFDVKDVDSVMEDLVDEKGRDLEHIRTTSKNEDDYTYNMLWDRIETELHDEATGNSNSESSSYDTLREELAELQSTRPDDEDVRALIEYFDEAGKKLGHESSGLLDDAASDEDESDQAASDEAAEKEAVAANKTTQSKDAQSSATV